MSELSIQEKANSLFHLFLVSAFVFCTTNTLSAQNGLKYEEHKSFTLENTVSTTDKQKTISSTHLNHSVLTKNTDLLHQNYSDTAKWNSHRFKTSIFTPTGAPPAVERLIVGTPLTPSDSSDLQDQKRFSYHLLADFVSYVSGQPVEYLNEIEEIVSDEAIMVDAELFFDHQDSTIEFLEEIDLAGNFRSALSDKEIAARMKAIEKEVPFNYTPEVRNFIEKYGVKYYTYTNTLIAKSDEYFPLFEKILKEQGMPEELKYLVVVESAFKTQVRSHAGAVGLWQFMPRTGKVFDLNQNFYIDERMDPTSSTIAACKYLKYLNEFFDGDWELAIAAYNCGPGNVKKAMRRSGKNTFWEIYNYLPRETRAYVPLYTTYAYLFNYAEDHGMVVENPVYAMEYDTVFVSQYVNLDKLADELRMCAADLKAMNPEAKRGIIPNYAKEHPIRIPKNRSEFFWKSQEEILIACQNPNYRSSTTSTATRTASNYKNTKANTTTAQSYTASARTTTTSRTYKKPSGTKSYHVVSKGETLGGIAVKYGTSVSSLRRWNGIYGSRINIGQKIVMYGVKNNRSYSAVAKTTNSTSKRTTTTTSSSTKSSGTYHVVKQGDTLWGIANNAGISVSRLKQLNNLRSDKLNVGQRLKVM
ncbi:lytic transglycosylase domain-containing protein [Bernardetia sp.]|uniref:lytic transglycosylase domain-containing protein n=1 Tax=Bernardetia sp. TaxID=1937974 RepID=UPI0025B8B40A|nr:lytic transglycosylase domain-containing protein [Bernardetia sp.]